MPSEKTLKRIVIILGVIIVIGFMTLIGIIVYRLVTPKTDLEVTVPVPVSTVTVGPPEGSRLIKYGQSEAVTVFLFETESGGRAVMIIDNQTSEVLADMLLDDMDEDIRNIIKQD